MDAVAILFRTRAERRAGAMLYHDGRDRGNAAAVKPPAMPILWAAVGVLVILASVLGAGPSAAAATPPPDGTFGPAVGPRALQGGLASIARDRLEGHTTASGELYNRNTLTAAHPLLPFGTLVRVTNLENRRSVVVRINDRGPAAGNRVIDLTPRAAAAIGLQGIAMAQVKLEIVGQSASRLAPPPDDRPASQ